MGIAPSCIKSVGAVVQSAHSHPEPTEKLQACNEKVASGSPFVRKDADSSLKAKATDKNLQQQDPYDDLPIFERERTRSLSTCSNDSYTNYDDSEIARAFSTTLTPEEYATTTNDREPKVVRFSFEKGARRHYYVGWDDPLYFIGWEVFIERLGVGHIVTCLGPYFSGVRFQIQLQDGRVLDVPFSHRCEDSALWGSGFYTTRTVIKALRAAEKTSSMHTCSSASTVDGDALHGGEDVEACAGKGTGVKISLSNKADHLNDPFHGGEEDEEEEYDEQLGITFLQRLY